MSLPQNKSDPPERKAQALRALDAARKRRERAARRVAHLVEIRLTATVEQRARLFEIMKREQLTILLHPRQVLAAVRSEITKKPSSTTSKVQGGLTPRRPQCDQPSSNSPITQLDLFK